MNKTCFASFLITFWIAGCTTPATQDQMLIHRIDSLEHEFTDTYKPGLGEFMSSIQIHHAKLWFAGQKQNWALADFEIHEIIESIDDIKKYETDRPETKGIDMIKPALDSVRHSIEEKSSTLFNRSYILLTNTCNTCHVDNKFEFNVVKVPESPPFSNQSFELRK